MSRSSESTHAEGDGVPVLVGYVDVIVAFVIQRALGAGGASAARGELGPREQQPVAHGKRSGGGCDTGDQGQMVGGPHGQRAQLCETVPWTSLIDVLGAAIELAPAPGQLCIKPCYRRMDRLKKRATPSAVGARNTAGAGQLGHEGRCICNVCLFRQVMETRLENAPDQAGQRGRLLDQTNGAASGRVEQTNGAASQQGPIVSEGRVAHARGMSPGRGCDLGPAQRL
jgi:hypothetical protein